MFDSFIKLATKTRAKISQALIFTQLTIFSQRAIAFQNFPTQQQDVDPQWKSLSNWIRNHTEPDAIVISYPWKLANFTWMTERATVVKLKMFPQTKNQLWNITNVSTILVAVLWQKSILVMRN